MFEVPLVLEYRCREDVGIVCSLFVIGKLLDHRVVILVIKELCKCSGLLVVA